MGFKVDVKGSSKSNAVQDQDNGESKQEKPFVKNTDDNKIFPEIQVKDISVLIDENTIGMVDADTMIYQAASNTENKYILVEHNTEEVTVELKGSREFKGQTKEISEVSWLGVQNAKRKVQKLEPWLVSDFTITNKSKLKYETEELALERAKITIMTKLKNIRLQFGIDKLTMVIGEGDNFRHKLPLCKPYKGNRADTLRPIILKPLREWVVKERGAIEAELLSNGENVEADDTTEYYGRLGYVAYRRTGIFSYIVLASDKDAMGHAKLLINPDTHTGEKNPLRGQFKYPQAMLIEATDKCVGGVDLVVGSSKKEIKGFGFKWLIYQAILGEDGADNYSALKHLGKKFNYGEVAAYEDLFPLNTPQEVLQKAIDVCAGFLPYGVQYADHIGEGHDVDTLTYMNTYFAVAYMLKSASDTMTFTKLCTAFKVDTSSIVNNNTMAAPKLTFNKDGAKENVDKLKASCENMLPDLKGFKAKKKGDLVELIGAIVENHTSVIGEFDSFYEMKQEPKELPLG
tara:strand:- start:10667 stop:12214 length:1548 start_codon:yes stop_codon:yes gene_type:complete